MLGLTVAAHAQSSVNTYSPYTFYGLGDLQQQGTAAFRGMGGVGVAARGFGGLSVSNSGLHNYVNPASLSMLPRSTFHFDFGLEGGFFYLKEGDKKTSYNTFNIRDLVFRMPLGRRLGFGATLTPYSSVGYRVKQAETDPSILAQLMEQGATGVDYLHRGSGDITQAKFSLGWEPVKRLSLGVDMIYYFGETERSYTTQIYASDPDNDFAPSAVMQAEKVSRIRWGVGAQYDIIQQSRRVLTVGATYMPELSLKADISVEAANATAKPQPLDNAISPDFKLPETIAAGLHYQTWRLGAGIDYEYQGWANGNTGRGDMSFRNTNAFRAGMEYTPSRHDVRSPFKRVTYRLGVRQNDYYMSFGGRDIKERAVALGFGIPFKTDRESYLDLGLEYGSRGSAAMVKENFFRISIGFRLSGDGWFQKMMYM